MSQTLGTCIRQARTKAGLTVRALAEQADMSHGYLVKLETGQNDKPSGDVLQRIADVLKIDSSTLLAYIGIKPSSTLPSTRMFFRRKYGIPEDEAEILANLVEYQMRKRKEESHEETDQERHDDPD